MKYVDIKSEQGTFSVVSDNGTINVNIANNHPELIFEDNSMLIFDDIKTYYKLIGNANLYIAQDKEVNVETLLTDYNIKSDTVSNFSYKNEDVNSIYEIEFKDHKIYYIQRTGINKIANGV